MRRAPFTSPASHPSQKWINIQTFVNDPWPNPSEKHRMLSRVVAAVVGETFELMMEINSKCHWHSLLFSIGERENKLWLWTSLDWGLQKQILNKHSPIYIGPLETNCLTTNDLNSKQEMDNLHWFDCFISPKTKYWK